MKKLLLKIALLPKKHQEWIIKHLPDVLLKKFVSLEGFNLLKKAQVFGKLSREIIKIKEENHLDKLPKVANSLLGCSNLFIAIILFEGKFAWGETFLNQHINQRQIREIIAHEVQSIKPCARELVLNHWAR